MSVDRKLPEKLNNLIAKLFVLCDEPEHIGG